MLKNNFCTGFFASFCAELQDLKKHVSLLIWGLYRPQAFGGFGRTPESIDNSMRRAGSNQFILIKVITKKIGR